LWTQMQMSPCHLDRLPSCIAWPMASQSQQWLGGRERPCCLSPLSVTDKRNSLSVSGPWHCPTWVLTPARLIMEEDLLHPIVSGCRCMALCTLHLESRNSCDMWWHVQMHLVDQQPPQDLVVTGLHDLRAGTTVLQSLLHRRDLECVRSVFGLGCPRQSTSQTRAFWFHAKSTLGWDRLWNGWKKARRWGRARDWRSRGTTTRWASIKPKPKTVAATHAAPVMATMKHKTVSSSQSSKFRWRRSAKTIPTLPTASSLWRPGIVGTSTTPGSAAAHVLWQANCRTCSDIFVHMC